MITPVEIAKKFVESGKQKTSMPMGRMFVLGIFAGIYIAIAGAGAAIASAVVDNASIARLMNALIFPGGLVLVILAGSELFTGNSLIFIAVLDRKVTLRAMLKNWAVVYLGNLCGALFVAFFFTYGHTPDLYNEQMAAYLVNLARAKVSMTWTDAVIRGMLCNLLVCAAVWVAAASSSVSGKIMALYLPIAVFILGGYEHCVANMFYIPAGIFCAVEYGITAAGLNTTSFVVNNLLPVTVGNILGGAGIMALGYWFVYLRKTDS